MKTGLKLKLQPSGVPAGTYNIKFLGVEEAPKHEDYGEGLRWEYEVVSGPHKGSKVGRITAAVPTAKNNCRRQIEGMLGKALTPEFDFAIDDFVGKTFIGIVKASGENGGTYLDSVSVMPV